MQIVQVPRLSTIIINLISVMLKSSVTLSRRSRLLKYQRSKQNILRLRNNKVSVWKVIQRHGILQLDESKVLDVVWKCWWMTKVYWYHHIIVNNGVDLKVSLKAKAIGTTIAWKDNLKKKSTSEQSISIIKKHLSSSLKTEEESLKIFNGLKLINLLIEANQKLAQKMINKKTRKLKRT